MRYLFMLLMTPVLLAICAIVLGLFAFAFFAVGSLLFATFSMMFG